MKLLPLIAALLLSTAPAHSSKTPEELLKPCEASEEAEIACKSVSILGASVMTLTVLCGLREDGVISPSSWPDDITTPPTFKEDFEKVMWDLGVKSVLKDYPNCPIKPVP